VTNSAHFVEIWVGLSFRPRWSCLCGRRWW